MSNQINPSTVLEGTIFVDEAIAMTKNWEDFLETSQEKFSSNQTNPSTGPEGTIPVDEAIAMTKNRRDYLETSNDKFSAKSYLIPIIDFKNILKYNPDAENVRAYIGLENVNDPTSSKLILVPVVNGKDVIYKSTSDNPALSSDPESNIYDITKVCPPLCDFNNNSPLNQ
jgi:hypothetical protein